MKRAAGLALTLVMFTSGAHAQSGRGDTCASSADSPRDRVCLQRLVAGQELRLAEVWKRTFARMGGTRTPAGRSLLAGQRAWITFKDRACALYFLPGMSPSLEWANGMRCKANVTLDRIGELERIHADFPGED
jgi:uncharacterized protein YecT (DUF1311 family)